MKLYPDPIRVLKAKNEDKVKLTHGLVFRDLLVTEDSLVLMDCQGLR